ncbi:MAG: ABC transporter ATP-binding protein [Acidobacteriaceae bacterium]|nr:ABC transporter ATP-binding protein [Acidobacteriaceae bacterium]MBV9500186.1 ABC transporter ATP-binding protein [Acidobacteriaceae bacterium]
MALLEVQNVSKAYKTQSAPVVALQNVSFEIDPGEFAAVVGRSGCGKSTLLNVCGAMDFPTSGEVVIDGQITSRLNDAALTRLRRQKIGFIFQSFQLLHTLTIAENVELPLMLAGEKNTRRAALERLDWVELPDVADRYPHQISGGQQQRTAIARALVHNPRLLLADEPTGNLDTVTGDIILQLLHRTAHELRVAVVMATHGAESTAAADRVIAMRDGRLETATVFR